MNGSGIEKLAIAAGVIATGSVKPTLSGRHYNRAMRLHKLVVEASLQMLNEKCVDNHPDILNGLEHVVDITTEKESEEFAAQDSFQNFVRLMFEGILQSDSYMAKFWLCYIIDIEVLFSHYHCLRNGLHFEEYIESCRRMLHLLAAYGNINYLRHLTLHFWRMFTMTEDQKNK